MMSMKNLIDAAKRAIGLSDVEKRNGLYVSRPVLNGQEWFDWAVKHGVPNPLAAEDMHVTVIYSTKDVKMPQAKDFMVLETFSDGYCGGAFAMLGPKEDVFTFCFNHCWRLHDRHWAFLSNGAETKWPTYRPHMTLGEDVGDFEISDAALLECPRYVVLGPEVYADLKQEDTTDASAELDPEGDGEDPDLVVIVEVVAKAAEKILKEADGLNPSQFGALYEISKGKVSAPVLKRLSAEKWVPAEIKKAAGPVKKSRDITIQLNNLPEDVKKALGSREAFKATGDDERMVIGIASVSTVKGVLVEDAHGDTITTQALIEFSRDIVRGTRAGKFEHEGDQAFEIVQSFVLSEDIQKSLGIDLGYEPYLIEGHVPGDEDWANVKSGEWMLSIAGRLFYEEE